MRKTTIFTTLAAALAMCGLSLPAVAQQSGQQSNQQYDEYERGEQSARQRQQQRDRRTAQQRRADRQQRRETRQGQSAQDQRFRLRPSGWVRVAVDYDQDNRFDAFETIYYFDLERARERSAQRRGQQGQQQQQQQQQQMARSQSQRQQLRRISGRVTNLTTVRLNDGQQHRLAKLETQQGQRVPVDLGRSEQIQQLNLQEGDRIEVWGTRARINDRPVLSARRVQTQDRQVTIDRERDRDLKRVRGQVASLRTARFRGKDQPFRVARVELNSGRTETVVLGPQSQLNNLNLQQGDEVRLLVRPGRLNDQTVLVADQIRANERTVRVPRPEEQRLTSRQQD